MMHDAAAIRARLQFDVGRLREAAGRLGDVDAQLWELRRGLEARARALSAEATCQAMPEQGGEFGIRHAQAQATAQLARRAVLNEVLRSKSPVSLIAAMAVSRWVGALRDLTAAPAGERRVRVHVEAGRVAYRVLGRLRMQAKIESGAGRLTSAVVVSEFIHVDDRSQVDEEIERGLHEARFARRISSAGEALAAASSALREAATLLDSMAAKANSVIADLRVEAADVERVVVERLTHR